MQRGSRNRIVQLGKQTRDSRNGPKLWHLEQDHRERISIDENCGARGGVRVQSMNLRRDIGGRFDHPLK